MLGTSVEAADVKVEQSEIVHHRLVVVAPCLVHARGLFCPKM